MKVFRQPEHAAEEAEVLLFCLVGGNQTAVLARPHWFTDRDGNSTVRRLAWQSTWDGQEIPKGWAPYAYATFEAPDPAA